MAAFVFGKSCSQRNSAVFKEAGALYYKAPLSIKISEWVFSIDLLVAPTVFSTIRKSKKNKEKV
jgi:hypothetical protein